MHFAFLLVQQYGDHVLFQSLSAHPRCLDGITVDLGQALCRTLFLVYLDSNPLWHSTNRLSQWRLWIYFQGESETGKFTAAAMTQGENLYAIVFFLYVNDRGINVWNVAVVLVVILCYNWISLRYVHFMATNLNDTLGCLDDTNQGTRVMLHVQAVWAGLPVLFAILDLKARQQNQSATNGENETLLQH